MSKKEKKTKKSTAPSTKETVLLKKSTDSQTPIWVFDQLDKDGLFRFDLNRSDFNHKEFLDKMISYSNISWIEIKKQTHDQKNKSKHHFLDYDSLSAEAKDRIKRLNLEEDTDRIFSFALQNKLRIIGLRDDEFFHVIWYDPEHNFCPSNR